MEVSIGDTELAKVYFDLGRQLVVRNQLAEAEEAFKKAIIANPAEAKTYAVLGILLHQQNRIVEAEEYFQKAIAADQVALSEIYATGEDRLNLHLSDHGAQTVPTHYF